MTNALQADSNNHSKWPPADYSQFASYLIQYTIKKEDKLVLRHVANGSTIYHTDPLFAFLLANNLTVVREKRVHQLSVTGSLFDGMRVRPSACLSHSLTVSFWVCVCAHAHGPVKQFVPCQIFRRSLNQSMHKRKSRDIPVMICPDRQFAK